MAKKILIGLVVVVIAFLVVVSMQPATFKVERSTTVNASPDIVYAQVADFHQWANWSPWDKMDPQMKRTFEGNASGAGAGYSWVGNDKVGEGRMTITEAKPNEHITIKLEFMKPFAATNNTEFTFKPEGANTQLTWSMNGDNNFMAKAFGLFKDMEKMIGPDFEKGLADIKSISEAEAKKRASTQAVAPAVAPVVPTAPVLAVPAKAAAGKP